MDADQVFKAYVWTGTPHDDYFAGMGVAVARSEEEALDLIARQYPEWLWGATSRGPSTVTPEKIATERAEWKALRFEVHDLPWAGSVGGGG